MHILQQLYRGCITALWSKRIERVQPTGWGSSLDIRYKCIYIYIMTSALDFAECRDCLCLAARSRAQRLTRLFDEKLRPFELTINQYSLLTALILGGPTTMNDLAERLGVERTTLTRNLALVSDRRLVTVTPGKDGRERDVTLTPKGWAAAKAALPAWKAAQAEASAD
jgi:DNA-binding MarR family transcriptional regulator